jgi:cell division protein YceG involved in septum cleavage
MKFMNEDNDKVSLKKFFIKLIAITFSIIVVINITYNLIFAEKFDNIDKLLSLSDKESVELIKNKIKSEIKKGLLKDKIINDEDKILFYDFYQKVKKEFQEIEKL